MYSIFGSIALRSPKKLNRSGFTLIEILIVIAIIGAVLAAIAPKIGNKKSEMKAAVRHLAALTHEIHNAARLYNSTFRLVLKYDEKKGHSYFIESSSGNVTLLSEEQQDDLKDEDKEKEAKRAGFSEDARVLKKPQALPSGLFFAETEYGNRDEAIEGGVAYIHFFPQGLTEEAVIHLTDKKTLNWTIALHPITGHANIFEKKVSLKELRSQ